jgi:hypothetical protein
LDCARDRGEDAAWEAEAFAGGEFRGGVLCAPARAETKRKTPSTTAAGVTNEDRQICFASRNINSFPLLKFFKVNR